MNVHHAKSPNAPHAKVYTFLCFFLGADRHSLCTEDLQGVCGRSRKKKEKLQLSPRGF